MPKLSVETEFDKNNKIIGEAKADCMLLLEFKRCQRGNCPSCSRHLLINDLYNKSASIDKLAIDKIAANTYAIRYQIYKDRYKKILGTTLKGLKDTTKMILLLGFGVLCVILVFLLGNGWFHKTSYYPREVLYSESTLNDERLYDVLSPLYKQTHYYITDVDKNGEINCVDYSITFKILYDMNQTIDWYKGNCEIVRNSNEDFQHLFIRVRYDPYSEWEYIEPQNISPATMDSVWGMKYNPIYNIYGETNKWIKRKK